MPWAGTLPTAGNWMVPSGVTLPGNTWPPKPDRPLTVYRKSSSFVSTFTGVTVMAGTL